MKNKNVILGSFTAALLGGFIAALILSTPVIKTVEKSTGLVGDLSIAFLAIEKATAELTPANDLKNVNSHELKVKTNSVDGYTISINSKTDETGLTSETTSDKIAAIDGTISVPKALAVDTWGYAIEETNNEIPSATSSKWIGITPEAVTFYTSDEANEDGDGLDEYFAANASEYIEAGTYTNTVVYTVAARTDVATIPAPIIDAVTPSFGALEGGDEITIVGENFTKNGSSITTEVLVGGKVCTNVTVLANTPMEGKDTIKCVTPAGDDEGFVDVKVTTWGGEATKTNAFNYNESEIGRASCRERV